MRDPAGAVDGEVDGSAAVELRRGDGTEIRTFLIADVRGYTRFTHERGDEAAAELAATFAAIARETVESMGGRLLELRGDEALSVFGSPRQAIRTAVALQERFVEHTLDNPALPLRVGIGIDAGEAVPVEGGYRGGALNLAARLCSQAGPGQVLASGETAHFARRVDGLEYIEHGRLQVKGLQEPVRVVRVVPGDGDPADRLPEPAAEPASGPGSWRDRRWRIGLVGGLAVLGAIAVAYVLARSPSDPAPVVVPEDSVAIVDQETGRVVDAVRVGGRPGEIVVSGDSAWIANESDSTVTRVDLETREVVQTIGLGFEPTGMAAGGEAVWVVGGFQRRLVRIDQDGLIRLTVGFEEQVPLRAGFERGPAGVAVGPDGVWVSHGIEVTRFDPRTGEVEKTVQAGGPWTNDIAVGEGAVWVAFTTRHLVPPGDQRVWSAALDTVDPRSGRRTARIPLVTDVVDLEVSDRFVWAALEVGDTVWRIGPHPPHVDGTIPAGDAPVAIAVDRWLWAANKTDATVTKIDLRTGEQLVPVPVGGILAGLATTGDELWVTVRA